MRKKKINIAIGNTFESSIATANRGWFIGHFIDPKTNELNFSSEVEVKWGVHKKNQQKEVIGTNTTATTLTLLISGKFTMLFPEQEKKITLCQQGDYLIFPAGIAHAWIADADSVVLTVRWPSIKGDQAQSAID